MAQEEILKIKAEIFDIICQQEEYVSVANTLQQERNQKTQQLITTTKCCQNIEKTSSSEDIIKLKAEIFDIILNREKYMAIANDLQQTKSQKLQQLADAQKDQQSQNVPKQPDIKQ